MKNSFPRVFIGSSSEALHLAQALQANLDVFSEVRIWNQDLFQTGNSALEDLLLLANQFDFAIFFWSPDDNLTSRGQKYLSPRDNVIFEAGMFYSTLGKERVFLVLPIQDKPKLPSDLAGINHLFFREPSDNNYKAALVPVSRSIQERVRDLGFRQKNNVADKPSQLPIIYSNVRDAWASMKADCYEAETIAILANRGLGAIGTDQSLISLAEADKFSKLRKVRIILLSEESRWLHEGFLQLRQYETLDVFIKELRACHEIMESALGKLSKRFGTAKSGIKYHLGEPKFSIVLTDKAAYVNSYAEPPSVQVVDLPIYRFEKCLGSLYGAFKRHFDDIWHNKAVAGRFQKETIDLETSAGGIVIAEESGHKYVALLRRHDGYWVLPKGHRMLADDNLEQTAIREVSEETGLNSNEYSVEKLLGYYSYDEIAETFNVTKVVHLFLMRCNRDVRPSLNPPEHAEAIWWDITKPLPKLLHTYQGSYLHEVIATERHQKDT